MPRSVAASLLAESRAISYNHDVQSSARRAIALSVAIVLSALVFSLAVRPGLSLRGITGPTIQLAESPGIAFLWTLGCFAACVAIACVLGRLINAVVAMFVLGCGVGLLALRSGTIVDVAFSGARLPSVAIETFAWAAAVLVASLVVFAASGPLPDAVPIEEPRVDGPFGFKGLFALTAALAVLGVVWLGDVIPAKGQAVGMVIVGSMLGALGGRLISPRTPPVLFFAAPILFGAIGQLVAAALEPSGVPLARSYVLGTLSRLAYPMPIDYAAGSLVGVSLGIGWARSFIKTETIKGEPSRKPA